MGFNLHKRKTPLRGKNYSYQLGMGKMFSLFFFAEALAFVRMRSVLGTKMAEAMLTARFATITGREHIVRQLAQRVFMVFVKL